MIEFMKLIERMDWAIPCRIRLSIGYDGEPMWLDEDEEVAGGVTEYLWDVAEAFDADGRQLEWPDCHEHVRRALEAEAYFEEEILGYCEEDFAHREAADWD